jgi:hypothetical protein
MGLDDPHQQIVRFSDQSVHHTPEALADVRFGAHSGLKSNVAQGPKSADSVAKVFSSHRSQIFRAVGAAIEYLCEGLRHPVTNPQAAR